MTKAARLHLLTVAVEDYFHATALNPLVPHRHWDRMESRVEANTDRALELLARYDQRATFFVLGWVAERLPQVVQRIVRAGHEVASKGYDHRPLQSHTRESFREDVRRSKAVIERASGLTVLGFRIPQGHFRAADLWALDVLWEEGYRYDSSIFPRFRSLGAQPWRRFPHVHRPGPHEFLEFPLSTGGPDGFLLPLAGGNYLRQLPALMQVSFRQWHRRYASPFNMYFHIWELDSNLPDIATAGTLTRLRQYRNLAGMSDLLSEYLRSHRFTSIASYSRWEQVPCTSVPPASEPGGGLDAGILPPSRGADVTKVTIVVPCFNEARVLGYLENALRDTAAQLRERYSLHFVLVDDCSTDDTWQRMQTRFAQRADVTLVRHERNGGVAQAILTGIKAAPTEIVCSMDADCTYDPKQLAEFIPLLTEDVCMVTASPYHRDGCVVGVPGWRLVLSRSLSRMYAQLLNHRFATYTACFRAYRKSQVEHISLDDGGFLGVAEMLIRLDLQGKKLRECPATLEARLLGVSKLKTMRTILGHLRLIGRIPELRRAALRGGPGPLPAQP